MKGKHNIIKHQKCNSDLLSVAILDIYSTLKIRISNQQTQTFRMTIRSLTEGKKELRLDILTAHYN